MTDEQLLAAFVAGDQTAFAELVERYQEPLTRYVAAMGLEPDDVVQAAFIYTSENAHRFIPGKSVKPWLYGTVDSLVHKQKAANRRADAELARPEMAALAETYQR